MDFKLIVPRETQKTLHPEFLPSFYGEFSKVFPKSKLHFHSTSDNWYFLGQKYRGSRFLLQNEVFSLLENEDLFNQGIYLSDYKINFSENFQQGELIKKSQTIKINEYLTREEMDYLIQRELAGEFIIDPDLAEIKYFDLEPDKKRTVLFELELLEVQREYKETLESKLFNPVIPEKNRNLLKKIAFFMPKREDSLEEDNYYKLFDRISEYSEEQIDLINLRLNDVPQYKLPSILKICLDNDGIVPLFSVLCLPPAESDGNYIRDEDGNLRDY